MTSLAASLRPWTTSPLDRTRELRKRRHVTAMRATVTAKEQNVREIDEVALAGKLKGASRARSSTPHRGLLAVLPPSN